MVKAIDFAIKNPVFVKGTASAVEAVQVLINSEAGYICTAENGVLKGLITPYAVVVSLRGEKSPECLQADNLALQPCPVVRPEAGWMSFIPDLKKYGAMAVLNDQGIIEGVITLNRVMTLLADKNEELERELDAVIKFSSDEILVADGKGKVLRANAIFEENFGVKLSAVLGKTVDELEKKKIFFPSVTKLVLDKKNVQTVIQSRRDGRKLLATGTPAFNQDGSVFRVIVNTRDITRLNRLKQQLEEAELLKNRYQQELTELRQGYLTSSVIVASSPAMLELIKVAKKIAAVDSTVLLTGESGSGKGMIARYIHNSSPRSEKPFTVVNCGAIPENLLESELFGYAGGAFTGARREGKIGKLELANEGTLFLDEITELPLNLQVKLLHVIQEGLICRIGGTSEIKLNLRFIAATNRDIVRLVEEGKFREDLFFRLDVIPLQVPSLQERREDIKPLVEQFLEKLSRRYAQHKYFSPDAYKYLENYHWPGNVRELENLIERMMIVVEGDEIGVQHLPRHLVGKGDFREGTSLSGRIIQPLREAREAMEKALLTEAMRRYRTTYEIAEVLEIDQSTVVRKINKYKLGPAEQAGQ
jgi:PAS domain S-box-containing protein